MSRHQRVAELVEQAYATSDQDFAQWMWQFHLQIVAKKAAELADTYGADPDIAVAGAWLHDFGDAFTNRHSPDHEQISNKQGRLLLEKAGYLESEIDQVMDDVIAPHSCQNDFLPTTVAGKVMATADALAHLNTDFYLQFAWKHLPEGKNYQQYIEWVREKIERDFNTKIFFEAVKNKTRQRYLTLKELFVIS